MHTTNKSIDSNLECDSSFASDVGMSKSNGKSNFNHLNVKIKVEPPDDVEQARDFCSAEKILPDIDSDEENIIVKTEIKVECEADGDVPNQTRAQSENGTPHNQQLVQNREPRRKTGTTEKERWSEKRKLNLDTTKHPQPESPAEDMPEYTARKKKKDNSEVISGVDVALLVPHVQLTTGVNAILFPTTAVKIKRVSDVNTSENRNSYEPEIKMECESDDDDCDDPIMAAGLTKEELRRRKGAERKQKWRNKRKLHGPVVKAGTEVKQPKSTADRVREYRARKSKIKISEVNSLSSSFSEPNIPLTIEVNVEDCSKDNAVDTVNPQASSSVQKEKNEEMFFLSKFISDTAKLRKKLNADRYLAKRREAKKLSMRRLRETIKLDPERLEECRRKDRERAKARREKISDMPENEKSKVREAWKQHSRNYRERKKRLKELEYKL